MEQYRSYALGSQPRWLSRYISSLSFDREICEYVKMVLIVHVEELYNSGNIEKEAYIQLVNAVRKFDCLKLREEGYEDIHEAIEYHVTKLTEYGKWLNLGKSRNDQVATALRMKVREEILDLMDSMYWLLVSLFKSSIRYRSVEFPTFTHFQPAQPSTLGHYLISFAEEIVDLMTLLFSAFRVTDKCPMGSAAVAGTTVPLNRKRICERLCFSDIALNTIYATTSRTFFLSVLSALDNISVVLLRFVEDMFLFSNPVLNLIEVPAEHAGTSSIMPHKRNPATLEVARAELLKVHSTYEYAFSLLKGLPSGYCLDLQQLSPAVWPVFKVMRLAFLVLADFVERLRPGSGIENIMKYPLRAADLAEFLSLHRGVPFRDAYKTVATALKEHNYNFQEVVDEILKGEQLPHPILSRRNEGSPGAMDSTYRKVRRGIEDLVSFLNKYRSKLYRCNELAEA